MNWRTNRGLTLRFVFCGWSLSPLISSANMIPVFIHPPISSGTSLLPLVTAVIGLVGALLGVYFGAHLSFRNQVRLATYQGRQQAYAAIAGNRALLMQLLVSRFEAHIHSDYHERLWQIAGYQKDSIDFEEAKRWMQKSEELAIDIAKAKQSLYESIGGARSTFPKTDELFQLSDRILNLGSPTIAPPPQGTDVQAVNHWKIEAVKQLQQLVEREYGGAINALLLHLSINMRAP